jgi:hypothetical protein
MEKKHAKADSEHDAGAGQGERTSEKSRTRAEREVHGKEVKVVRRAEGQAASLVMAGERHAETVEQREVPEVIHANTGILKRGPRVDGTARRKTIRSGSSNRGLGCRIFFHGEE